MIWYFVAMVSLISTYIYAESHREGSIDLISVASHALYFTSRHAAIV